MTAATSAVLEPRKLPRQKRSEVTVDAVFQATIQVLLTDGSQRLTTTRVAERAGVSVGTLYQYFPNKQSLLYSVLERHLTRVGHDVICAAQSAQGASLEVMVSTVVEAFVRAKTERADEARALYTVASELDTAKLVKEVGERSRVAIKAMLDTSPGVHFEDPTLVSFMFAAAMVGPTRTMLEGGASAKMLRALRGQLESLCLGYLQREARTRSGNEV